MNLILRTQREKDLIFLLLYINQRKELMLTNPDLIVALILNILIYIYGLNTLNKPLKITVKVFCVENLYWFLMGIFIVLNLVFNVFILEQLPPSHVDLDSSKLTLFKSIISFVLKVV